jgi:hypothetical protein
MSDWIPSSVTDNAFQFLLTDLDTALTFMDVAKSTENEGTRQRNYANAREAYDTVVRLMQKLSLDNTQQEKLAEGLALLKSRLEDVGQQF